MRFPKIGQILPNGHTVDAAYCVGDARYVLAHRDGAPEPYVVWSVDQDGDTVNGRYFSDPAAAQKKFSQCCFDCKLDQKKSLGASIQGINEEKSFECPLCHNAIHSSTTETVQEQLANLISALYWRTDEMLHEVWTPQQLNQVEQLRKNIDTLIRILY